VAQKLRAFGLEVHESIGGTGVVGILRSGKGLRSIGLRAELDALPVLERTGLPYASTKQEVMHACGHDGHTAILLGAAKLLSQSRSFDGVVHFIFQPAEENDGGSMRMIDSGLFKRFPIEAVYAVYNWPGMPFGKIAARVGRASDGRCGQFRTELRRGRRPCRHAASGRRSILAAGAFIGALQRIVSRSIDPQTSLVVSLTRVHGGNVGNIVPGKVWLQGTCRFFDPALSDHCARLIEEISHGIASAHGVLSKLEYKTGYPPVINTFEAVTNVLEHVRDSRPLPRPSAATTSSMISCLAWVAKTSLSWFGCYAWVGTGEVGPGQGLHGDRYVFNDGIVPTVLRYWVCLVERVLSASQ
jgi:amidohydrolase